MKISHFPDFLPDETIFSICCRYLDRMQFNSSTIVSQHCFGRPKMSGIGDLPSSLEHLIQALPPHHVYTSDIIIDRHTHFPLYAPFLPPERSRILRQKMKKDGDTAANIRIAGVRRNGMPRLQWLRYCTECVVYDRSMYGECYWHRLHQIPWVLVCPIHEVMLENSSVNVTGGNKIAQFRSAEHSVNKLSCRKIPVQLYTTLQQIATDAKWLLENALFMEGNHIQSQYMAHLKNRNFLTDVGKMRYEKLKMAMLDYYPKHILDDLGCDITHARSWLINWRSLAHPLHHLLLMHFLCGSLQKFFVQLPSLSAPFGNGPWPCFNPLCPHYKNRVITSYTIKPSHQHRPTATFSCSCGFTYSRTGSNEDNLADFRGKILQFGDIWEQQLISYWLNQNISVTKIARLMHTTFKTVVHQAARLNLPFAPDIPNRGQRPILYSDSFEKRREQYRALWEEELDCHPNVTLTEASRNKAYQWLSQNDREWFKERSPSRIPLSQKHLTQGKIQSRHNSYSQADADWAGIIRQVAEDLYSSSNFPIRVTRIYLVAQIGRSSLFNRTNNAYDSLPLTSHALDECEETKASFIWRKLKWVVADCFNQQVLPSYLDFLKRARIDKKRTLKQPLIKDLVQIAYSCLCDGILLSDQMPEIQF